MTGNSWRDTQAEQYTSLRFNPSTSPQGPFSFVFSSEPPKHWRQCPLCWLVENATMPRREIPQSNSVLPTSPSCTGPTGGVWLTGYPDSWEHTLCFQSW